MPVAFAPGRAVAAALMVKAGMSPMDAIIAATGGVPR